MVDYVFNILIAFLLINIQYNKLINYYSNLNTAYYFQLIELLTLQIKILENLIPNSIKCYSASSKQKH